MPLTALITVARKRPSLAPSSPRSRQRRKARRPGTKLSSDAWETTGFMPRDRIPARGGAAFFVGSRRLLLRRRREDDGRASVRRSGGGRDGRGAGARPRARDAAGGAGRQGRRQRPRRREG